MTANTKHPVPDSLLHLEAEHLAAKIEQALCNPAATRDAFFLDVDHLADVLKSLRRDEATRAGVGVA